MRTHHEIELRFCSVAGRDPVDNALTEAEGRALADVAEYVRTEGGDDLAAGIAFLEPVARRAHDRHPGQERAHLSLYFGCGHDELRRVFMTTSGAGRAYELRGGSLFEVERKRLIDGSAMATPEAVVYESEARAVGRAAIEAGLAPKAAMPSPAGPYDGWSTEALAAEAERLYEAWALAVGGDAIRAEASFCRRAVDPDDRDRRGWFCSVTARGSEGDRTFGGAYFTMAGAAHAAIDNLRRDLTDRKERAERRLVEERARTSEMLAALDLTVQGFADALVPGGKRAAA